jgi:hypothetical protein
MQNERDRDPKASSGRARASHHPSDQPSNRQPGSKAADEVRAVRLTRKYADIIDGVDLTDANVGDRLNLSPHDAEVLIAEGWAEHAAQRAPRHAADPRSVAADKPRRHKPTRK